MRPGPRDGRRGSPGPGEDWAPPGRGGWDTSRRLRSRRGGRALRLSPGAGPWAPGGRGQNAAHENDPRHPFPVDPLPPPAAGMEVSARPRAGGGSPLYFSWVSPLSQREAMLPPSPRILVSRRNQRGTHRDLSDWAVGLQRTWRSAFLLRARAAALLCNKTQNTGDGDGSLTSRAPTSPCPSPAARGPAVAGAMLAAVPGSQGGSGPSPPRRGPAVPIPSALPHSRGSAVPRGNAASSPQLTAQQGPAAGRETTDAFSPIFPVGSSPERGGRRGRSTYTPASS